MPACTHFLDFVTVEVPHLSHSVIRVDFLINGRYRTLSAFLAEVALAVINCLELTAINGDQFGGRIAQAFGKEASTKRHTRSIASKLSLRKLAMVLKSGVSLPSSHISSKLRVASRSKSLDQRTRLR
jgi:hypothetical protein